MNDTIQIEHKGIAITYDEPSNVFKFTLRGRDREAKSLREARDIIDKPYNPKTDGKKFIRILAWNRSWRSDDKYRSVEVTSICAPRFSEHPPTEAWVSFKDERGRHEREKVSIKELFPQTAHNRPLIQEIQNLQKQIEALQAKQEKLAARLKHIEA